MKEFSHGELREPKTINETNLRTEELKKSQNLRSDDGTRSLIPSTDESKSGNETRGKKHILCYLKITGSIE